MAVPRSRSRPWPAALTAAGVLLLASTAATAPSELPELNGSTAEEFLRIARVAETEEVGAGVTRPQRLTLTDGRRTARAVWKTIDEFAPVKQFHDGRPPELGFRDSWKHEIAAYELDKLLGLGLVPPTVPRTIRGVEGAIQLWVDGSITESDRRRLGISKGDVAAWNRQIHSVRLLRQLTHDTDFNNTGNLLIDEGSRVWAIDHSRAFKTRQSLLAASDLQRFQPAQLERLRRLGSSELEAATGAWLSRRQRAALLARRDLIVRRADRLIAERGAAAVLLPR